MTQEEYILWADFHASIFQLHTVEDQAMFKAWMSELIEFELADATEASKACASQPHKFRFRSDHLAFLRPWLLNRVRDRMAIEAQKELQARVRQSCQICGDAGILIVPHRSCVREGIWIKPFLTGAVACVCEKGKSAFNQAREEAFKKSNPSRLIEISDYERLYPEWRAMMEAHDQAVKNRKHQRDATSYADQKHGEIKFKDIARNLVG